MPRTAEPREVISQINRRKEETKRMTKFMKVQALLQIPTLPTPLGGVEGGGGTKLSLGICSSKSLSPKWHWMHRHYTCTLTSNFRFCLFTCFCSVVVLFFNQHHNTTSNLNSCVYLHKHFILIAIILRYICRSLLEIEYIYIGT